MSDYKDILIRASLTDDGTLPRTGNIDLSPDLIPSGTTPVKNPVTYFIGNYGKNVSKTVEAEQLNYIYVRSKSLVDGVVEGDIYLYFAKDEELQDPNNWIGNVLKTQSGKEFVSVVGQSKGNILVGGDPFVWTTPDPGGSNYSLIGVVVPSGETPDFSGVTDFGRNKITIHTPPPPPTPKLRWQTSFNYTQAVAQDQMNFTLKCSNIPTGCMISFMAKKISGGDPSPAIVLDKTKVTDPNASYGITSSVPGDYKGVITFALYTTDSIVLPEASSLTFQASYLEGSGSGPKKSILVASVTTAN
jgi:hypothetical protein